MIRRPLAAALAAAVLAATAPAAASPLTFFDGFEGETAGGSILNYAGFANWTVAGGTVDLVRSGDFGITCRTGNYCVDLDGSSANGGILALDFAIPFNAGDTVTVEFWLSGNQRGGALDSQAVQLEFAAPTAIAGAVWTKAGVDTIFGPTPGVVAIAWNYTDVAWSTPFLRFGVVFTAAEAGSATLFFDDWQSGNDNVGMILDDVFVAVSPAGVIPEPATWAMLIAGFGLVGVAARRRAMARA